jgi:hypothetical protein
MYWNKTHGLYAKFARLTFETAVLTQQEGWTFFAFKDAFASEQPVDTTKARMNAAVVKMTWEDSSYFGLDELRFFCRVSSCENVGQARSEKQLADDRKDLLLTIKVCAERVLKAMDFWELRHKDKVEEWFSARSEAWEEQTKRERWKTLKATRDITPARKTKAMRMRMKTGTNDGTWTRSNGIAGELLLLLLLLL